MVKADNVEVKDENSKVSDHMIARLFPLALIAVSTFASTALVSFAADTRKLSVGTRLAVTMDSRLDSANCRDGDPIIVTLAEDVVWNGLTIVPTDSIISGRVFIRTVDPSLTGIKALELKFESIEIKHCQIPIEAVLSVRAGKVYIRRARGFLPLAIKTFESPAVGLGIGISSQSPETTRAQEKVKLKLKTEKEKAKNSNIRYGLDHAGQVLLLTKKKPKLELLPGDQFQIELMKDFDIPAAQ